MVIFRGHPPFEIKKTSYIYSWCGNGGFAASDDGGDDDGDESGMTRLTMVRMMVGMLAVLMMTAVVDVVAIAGG